MDKSNDNNSGVSILAMVLVFFGVLAMGFLARSVAFLFFMVVIAALFIVSVFYIINHFQKQKKEKEFASSLDGTLYQNIQLCENQINRNELELEDINQNISEIQEKLDSKVPIHESTIKESENLIKAFEREKELREEKLDFYFVCKEKLQSILYNQQLADDLKAKKDKLQQLQEDHYDDLAEMERLRSDMEYDRTYLETINELTLKMAESTSLRTAQELQKELKNITNELRDL